MSGPVIRGGDWRKPTCLFTPAESLRNPTCWMAAAANKIPRNCEWLAIYQFGRGASQVLLRCRPNSQEHPWEVLGPIWTRQVGP